MKKTNKLISILLSVVMLLSIVPINLSVSAEPDTNYVASVTDKDGNLIGDYETFEEAATSAKANPNSTLKLLDNADGCYVRVNSPLTLDLNGYTLDMGSQNFDIGSVLEGYDCHLTVTDTSETKTGKITSASYSSTIFVGYSESPGKLTVLNGILEHNNEFGCTIKLDNKGVAEIKGGTFKNTIGTEFYINKWVDNFEGSFDISGGIFPDGFEMNVYSSDYTSTENYLTDLLADGYCYYDADGKKIAVAKDATSIEGYAEVKECFVASVTDKDGNELEGSPYRTFDEAVTAAENTENSILTLLDDVSLAYEQYIYPGSFTLDLNGKTLLNETDIVLYIIDGADLTIKDSGEGGTIRTNAEGSYAIINLGLLTVECGKIYGGGIMNDISGTLIFNDGEIKSDAYSAISNIGTAYIYGGKIETTDLGAIENHNGGTMYIYDGTIIGNTTGISNSGSTYIMGGKITGAGSVAVYIKDGSVEIEGGSFTGKDIESGYYSGTPYGEWTIYCYENANLTLKGGEFPNGLVATDAAANSYLADGYCYYDADGKKIAVAEDATSIEGYAEVKEYFAASVTDENGNLIGNYKTFEESLDAAMVNENSTLTLLDDVIVTELCEITSGTFTIDLNGKTLSGEDTYINILSPVVLTITDSDENGTIEINYDDGSCIYNNGKLTVEKVTIKGARGIDNRGVCTLNGITIEVNDREALSNNGTVYIYNSVLKSEKENAIINNPDATLYVYDSKLTGEIGITNHDTAYVYNCEIKGTSYAALNLLSGTIEVTGSSLSGTDLPYGNYSGTPYGEWTVCRYDGVTLIFKDSEFPNGFVVNDISAHTFLAEGYHFRDADSNIINLTEGQRIIDGYVKVTKGADLEKEAVITLDRTEFVYNGDEIKPTVTVTVGGKTLVEGKDYTISFSNNTNAGTATVTIKAIGQTAGGIAGGIVGEGNVNIGNSSNDDAIDVGNYTGEITKEFTIIPVTVDIIWSETTEFEFDGNPHSVTATYVDVNGEVVNAEVENGTNTKPGKHTATAQITDANYVASEETTSVDYAIRGKVTLSGTVTTFLSETDEITLTLVKADDTDIAYETVVTGNSAEYVFDGLIEGTYTLTVSKNNHATRTYEVVVGTEDVSQNVKIHLKGDINGDGKLNSIDVARANVNVRGVSALTGYELACADANGDGKANSIDVARMNAHVRGTTALW